MKYIIHSNSKRGFWHNKLGWVSSAGTATKFNHDEYVKYNNLVCQLKTKENDAEWMTYAYSE